MVIRDLNAQVEKALNEIEMRYSKGIEFQSDDLMTVIFCKEATNFRAFKSLLEIKISNKGIASCVLIRNGIRTFRKK